MYANWEILLLFLTTFLVSMQVQLLRREVGGGLSLLFQNLTQEISLWHHWVQVKYLFNDKKSISFQRWLSFSSFQVHHSLPQYFRILLIIQLEFYRFSFFVCAQWFISWIVSILANEFQHINTLWFPIYYFYSQGLLFASYLPLVFEVKGFNLFSHLLLLFMVNFQ